MACLSCCKGSASKAKSLDASATDKKGEEQRYQHDTTAAPKHGATAGDTLTFAGGDQSPEAAQINGATQSAAVTTTDKNEWNRQQLQEQVQQHQIPMLQQTQQGEVLQEQQQQQEAATNAAADDDNTEFHSAVEAPSPPQISITPIAAGEQHMRQQQQMEAAKDLPTRSHSPVSAESSPPAAAATARASEAPQSEAPVSASANAQGEGLSATLSRIMQQSLEDPGGVWKRLVTCLTPGGSSAATDQAVPTSQTPEAAETVEPGDATLLPRTPRAGRTENASGEHTDNVDGVSPVPGETETVPSSNKCSDESSFKGDHVPDSAEAAILLKQEERAEAVEFSTGDPTADGAIAEAAIVAAVAEGQSSTSVSKLRSRAQSTKMSLEQVLAKKWKQLMFYVEEELLFKAYQYLLNVEQQVEQRQLLLQQNQMDEQQLLTAFQDQLNGDQRIVNLRAKIAIALTMLDQFHLGQLRAICEDPRLSFTDSIGALMQHSISWGGSASAVGASPPLQITQHRDPSKTAGPHGGPQGSSHAGPQGSPQAGTQGGSLMGARPLVVGSSSNTDGLVPESSAPAAGDSFRSNNSATDGGALPERKLSSGSHISTSGFAVSTVVVSGKYLDLSYRVEKDTSVSIKVRGKLPCRLFQVLSILNESDLAGNWAPMFKSAEKVHTYSRASQLIRQVFDYPLLGAKETIMYSFGANALEECGAVIIFCRSPPEGATEFMGKPIPKKGKVTRIQSANLVFLLYPISEGKQTTLELYGNFFHGLRYVPMRIITYVVKKVVRGMFVSIAKQCQHFATSLYKERVEANPDFYCWMRDCIEDFVAGETAHHFKQLESISLCSFNYEEFQD
ncbi:hypothetical protein cyc_03614 [Cyclospora cayetanensis]|uniref:START domain-containing protein n=1 Tax=Cyclospora cayetanensis TaxID=88456 RepID=A0A1D3D9R2_9EIME|nr:hypothetical protein cyc_03614 [Cyclospora cayetanensis]